MKVPIDGPLHRKTRHPDAPYLQPPTLRGLGHLSTHLRVLADDRSRLITLGSGFCSSAALLSCRLLSVRIVAEENNSDQPRINHPELTPIFIKVRRFWLRYPGYLSPLFSKQPFRGNRAA